MNLGQLIAPERVVQRKGVTSKKRALEVLGELLASADPDLGSRLVFDSLLGRERLGSTGLGQGVALPHGRLSRSRRALGAVLQLDQGIDFDAPDQQPVDLLFALVVPEHFTDEHLKILAYLAEMFSNQDFCQQLRASDSQNQLYQQLIGWRPPGE
ncbi:MAG: PTS IIA-like nitrogen regulatory protein PtsN [Candidatus Competibacterales bacterium]|nr:PTS IIA-like nitrogen regulatory protein PtsN [Candidatus Competibacterales bacterium]